MNNKNLVDLPQEEIDKRAKLTPVEEMLVNNAIKALKELPKSISVDFDEFECAVFFQKRITNGSAKAVATLRKKSLFF